MKVKFTDSFFESLEKMNNRERWYWKTWYFFRYDLLKGVRNIIFFWKVIWNFRDYDFTFQTRILKRSLEPLHKSILNSDEVEISRLKKAEKIARLIYLLENLSEDKYMELAEKKLGFEVDTSYLFSDEEQPETIKKANNDIYSEAKKIEEEEWEEIFQILKGQDKNDFSNLLSKIRAEKGKAPDDVWENWFDGTGLKGWWN